MADSVVVAILLAILFIAILLILLLQYFLYVAILLILSSLCRLAKRCFQGLIVQFVQFSRLFIPPPPLPPSLAQRFWAF